ncbi:MAG: alpha/beta hydrolase-fold protein [Pseudomonadota bacterium]
MRKTSATLNGSVIHLEFQSEILKDNALGDPSLRQFPVYLPPSYNSRNKRRYPVLFDLAGFTGAGPGRVGWKNFEMSIPERLDRLMSKSNMPHCIVVFPDCFTSYGGNQYINSGAVGNYADYLTKELIPFVDASFRTKPDRVHRGCYGKSSGGYGALIHGMRYSKFWGGIAAHSPDCYFELLYQTEWPAVLTHLQRWKTKPPTRAQNSPGGDDGRIARFLEYAFKTQRPSSMDITTLMMLCMTASYDPNHETKLGYTLPYDLNTGEVLPKRWQAWRKHDPLNMITKAAPKMRTLRAIFLDCGWLDQYHLHFGTRQLSAKMRQLNIVHKYQEFEGTHSGIDYRLDESLPYLARKLS